MFIQFRRYYQQNPSDSKLQEKRMQYNTSTIALGKYLEVGSKRFPEIEQSRNRSLGENGTTRDSYRIYKLCGSVRNVCLQQATLVNNGGQSAAKTWFRRTSWAKAAEKQIKICTLRKYNVQHRDLSTTDITTVDRHPRKRKEHTDHDVQLTRTRSTTCTRALR